MNRVKTFAATGVAPGGRIYAGDLNAIQDAAAALTDLTQNLSVGTVAIGEAGLVLSRFGAGEARLAGHMRFDGQVRGMATGAGNGIAIFAPNLAADGYAFGGKQAADTQYRVLIGASGMLLFGPGGTSSPDTNLYRSAANELKTDDHLNVGGQVHALWPGTGFGVAVYVSELATDGYALGAKLATDTQSRLLMPVNIPGLLLGAGGVAPPDTNLYRARANVLATDDTMALGGTASGGDIGRGGLVMDNVGALPSVITGGGILYVDGGVLKFRSSGNIMTVVLA